MALEIRPIRDEELEDFVYANVYAFNEDRRPQAVQDAAESMQSRLGMELPLAAFVDGHLAAGLRSIPLTIRVNGSSIRMAGWGVTF